jgi:hypothetical protein
MASLNISELPSEIRPSQKAATTKAREWFTNKFERWEEPLDSLLGRGVECGFEVEFAGFGELEGASEVGAAGGF